LVKSFSLGKPYIFSWLNFSLLEEIYIVSWLNFSLLAKPISILGLKNFFSENLYLFLAKFSLWAKPMSYFG